MWAFFGALLALNVVAPWPLLVRLKRRWELDDGFLGLVAIGAGASIAGYLAAMGLWLGYATLAPLPAELPREALARRWDVLFFTTVALGFVVEGVKCYGAYMFHSRIVRGNLPLFGVGVGAGAGMVQALWVLGAAGWGGLAGGTGIGLAELALGFRHVALTLLEVSVGVLVLYRAAEGHRAQGVAIGGAVHGAALLLAAVMGNLKGSPAFQTWAGTLVLVLASAGCAGVVWQWFRSRGWPM